MNISPVLYDDIGRTYERKNEYFADLAAAGAKGDSAEIARLKAGKNEHPYLIALAAYEREKKKFLGQLPKLIEAELDKLPEQEDKRLAEMERELAESRARANFFTPYADLTYEAMFEARQATLKVNRLPEMIAERHRLRDELRHAKAEGLRIPPPEQHEAKRAHKAFVLREKEALRKKNLKLKLLASEGQISQKAVREGIRANKKEFQTLVKADLQRLPKQNNRDLIQNINHQLNRGYLDQMDLLKEELADIARTTPIEVEPGMPWKSLVSIPLPGLGQLLNGQPVKAFWFFLGTLYAYLIALPYALGFGNYRGRGIAGLISLAEGGKRLDRSIIFMIEGIIALFLVLFAVIIFFLAARDAYKVEKGVLQGIRPKNRFEIRKTLGRKGFPYRVSLPALVLITFIVMVPIVTALLLSFTNMDPQHQSKFTWVGLENYKTIFLGTGLAGSVFWRILAWTVIWTILASTLQIVIGFMLALFANHERVRFKRLFRTVYILPWAVPAFITIMFFSIMMAPGGIFTNFLSGIAGQTVNIKHDPTLTKIALILIQGWCGSSYVFLLTTGVLQAIPHDLYEAAMIDGANSRQRLAKITLPLVLFQTGPLLISQYTFNFNNYSIIRIFNDGGPFEPSLYGNLAGTSDLLISYIYKLTMQNEYQALGAAISILISLGLIVIAFLGYRRTAAFKGD